MSEIKARYVGPSQTGVDLLVTWPESGDVRHVHVPHGGELPTEIDGMKVSAAFRDSLLQQPDNWTSVKRDDSKNKPASAGKDGE